jgi:cellulose synthase/poly-beta-1,6-N-acetylglucosamine synthase-like glycosyltransferase
MRRDNRITLIREEVRRGKASAVNQIIKTSSNDIIVLESGDTLPKEDAVEKLCLPFTDGSIGMTCACPVPVNERSTLMGYVDFMLWNLHHIVALKRAKCGEMIAFRRLFDGIPQDAVCDEAWIEYEIRRRGYKVVYVPNALVYNKGPETLRDFLKQRRRIICGHLDLRYKTGYRVSSLDISLLLSALAVTFPLREPERWAHFFIFVVLEVLGRLLGYYDYDVAKRNYIVWEVAESTKGLTQKCE